VFKSTFVELACFLLFFGYSIFRLFFGSLGAVMKKRRFLILAAVFGFGLAGNASAY
jgi:hypothetical protein